MILTAGAMKDILDFVYQRAEDSTVYAHALKERLIWFVQVRVTGVSSIQGN